MTVTSYSHKDLQKLGALLHEYENPSARGSLETDLDIDWDYSRLGEIAQKTHFNLFYSRTKPDTVTQEIRNIWNKTPWCAAHRTLYDPNNWGCTDLTLRVDPEFRTKLHGLACCYTENYTRIFFKIFPSWDTIIKDKNGALTWLEKSPPIYQRQIFMHIITQYQDKSSLQPTEGIKEFFTRMIPYQDGSFKTFCPFSSIAKQLGISPGTLPPPQ